MAPVWTEAAPAYIAALLHNSLTSSISLLRASLLWCVCRATRSHKTCAGIRQGSKAVQWQAVVNSSACVPTHALCACCQQTKSIVWQQAGIYCLPCHTLSAVLQGVHLGFVKYPGSTQCPAWQALRCRRLPMLHCSCYSFAACIVRMVLQLHPICCSLVTVACVGIAQSRAVWVLHGKPCPRCDIGNSFCYAGMPCPASYVTCMFGKDATCCLLPPFTQHGACAMMQQIRAVGVLYLQQCEANVSTTIRHDVSPSKQQETASNQPHLA